MVTLPSGFTNGDDCTACAALSGASFLLTDDGPCRWQYQEPEYCPSCQEIGYTLLITFALSADLSNRCVATLELQLIGPDDSACRGDILTWQRVYDAPDTFDCEGQNELDYVSVVTDGPACATYPTGVATVEPA